MRKKLLTLFTTLLILVSFSMSLNAQNFKGTEEALKNLNPYPTAIESLERDVIFLQPKQNESLYQIELIAGKKMEVDCNKHRLLGNFDKQDVQGWGFSYYVFNTNGEVISTMMACSEPKTLKFISAQSIQEVYNSRMPIVVYLPKNIELRYRIWSGGDEAIAHKN